MGDKTMTGTGPACSPGEHPHGDRRNFTVDDYLRMCRDGEAEFSLSECARLMGVSRMYLHRCMSMANTPAKVFEEIVADMRRRGRAQSTTAITDEIKRRTGCAKVYVDRCPHCGGALRERVR